MKELLKKYGTRTKLQLAVGAAIWLVVMYLKGDISGNIVSGGIVGIASSYIFGQGNVDKAKEIANAEIEIAKIGYPKENK